MRTTTLVLFTLVLAACGGSGGSGGDELPPVPPGPDPLVVTNLDDSGPGSLRDVMAAAPDGAVIIFDPALPSGTINLLSPLAPTTSVTIGGLAGDLARMSIDGGAGTQLFDTSGTDFLELRDFVLTNGMAGSGGAIFGNETDLVLRRVQFVGNQGAVSGGAIGILGGSLEMSDCAITANSAPHGGGLYMVETDAKIIRCSFYLNTGTNHGGGILAYRSPIEMYNTAFHNNSATNNGGGLFLSDDFGAVPASLIAKYCTWHENSAGGIGGGIHLQETGSGVTVELHASIVTNNMVGGAADDQDIRDGVASVTGTWNRIGIGPAGSIFNGFDNNVTGVVAGSVNSTLDPVAIDVFGRAFRTPSVAGGAWDVIPAGVEFMNPEGQPIAIDHQGKPRLLGAAGEQGAVETPAP